MDWLIDFINTYVVDFVVSLVLAAAVLFIGFKLVKFVVARMKNMKIMKRTDTNIGILILNTAKVVLNALIIIIAIQILGVPSATIVAVLGSCGLAVGLALQGGLSNLAGGVMIMIFKPFHTGDYICTKEGEGTVEEIDIFYTKLVTIDGRGVCIPNSVLSSNTVTNLSSKNTRGVDIELSVAYGSDIESARKTLRACAIANPLVMDEPLPIVFVSEHADSAVKLILRVFVKSSDYRQVRAELMEASLNALNRAGIEIPFPQMDVHMK